MTNKERKQLIEDPFQLSIIPCAPVRAKYLISPRRTFFILLPHLIHSLDGCLIKNVIISFSLCASLFHHQEIHSSSFTRLRINSSFFATRISSEHYSRQSLRQALNEWDNKLRQQLSSNSRNKTISHNLENHYEVFFEHSSNIVWCLSCSLYSWNSLHKPHSREKGKEKKRLGT